MAIQSFSRYERKYLISDAQKRTFLANMEKRFAADRHSGTERGYGVHNIYFDTEDNELVRTSLEKPAYKEKLRLRAYRMPVGIDEPVYLELKKKIDGRVAKRRIALSYRDALAFLAEGKQPHFEDYLDNQIASEIGWFVAHHPIRPNYYIGYDRIAYECTCDPDLRVTFDRNIRVRTTAIGFADPSGDMLLPDGMWLMEIKAPGNFPLWLATALSDLRAYSQGFSKYGAAYTARKTGEFQHVQ